MNDFTNFRLEIDADGIALATWDMPGRSMNVITPEVMGELERIIEKVAGDEAIKGCVITSGKEAFSGGADLTMLQGLGAEHARLAKEKGEEAAMQFFFEESRRLSLLYRRLETCGKPFAAAVHGVCLGGAFELALACHFRVLSDVDSTRVGLPEVKVGLFPGAGGTQRVARLMQTGDALQMLFKGEQLRPLMARNMGLAHAVAQLRRQFGAGGVEVESELGIPLRRRNARPVRRLVGAILEVDLLQNQFGLRRRGVLRGVFGHGVSCVSNWSSSPERSSAYSSSKPPTWREPMKICGTLRLPLRVTISARAAASSTSRRALTRPR